MNGVSGKARCEAAETAARAPSVAADEDFHDLRRVAVKARDLDVVDLAAVVAVTVDKLVVEDAEGEIDVCNLGSSLASVRDQHQRNGCDRDQDDDHEVEDAQDVRQPPVHVRPHVAPIVRNEEDRQVGKGQGDD